MIKPRVALFACAYNEMDGVANTIHHFESYAAAHHLPMLLLYGGFENRDVRNGSVRRVELRRKFPRFALDKKHDFDLLFWRYSHKAANLVGEFRPDIVHITGPSDVGMLGALIAHRLRIPLAASWHTNVHEYARQRAIHLLRRLPAKWKNSIGAQIQKFSLAAIARFYRTPQLLFAPNPELLRFLELAIGKKCRMMSRGVDTSLFSPKHRSRRSTIFTIGYVGRITAEKNISLLVELERELLNAGISGFRFMIAGQGALEPWLRRHLIHADFAGVLHGRQLAEAYADMDVFVFPSRTDTYGNVVLEALASGVPAIVSDSGGPRFIVRHNETGYIATNDRDYPRFVVDLMNNGQKREAMSHAAREYSLKQSWNTVFESVYDQYSLLIAHDVHSETIPAGRFDFSIVGAARQ